MFVIKPIGFVKLHQIRDGQAWCNLIFADLLQVVETTSSLWIKSFDNELASGLLTTRPLRINKVNQHFACLGEDQFWNFRSSKVCQNFFHLVPISMHFLDLFKLKFMELKLSETTFFMELHNIQRSCPNYSKMQIDLVNPQHTHLQQICYL